MKLIPVFFA